MAHVDPIKVELEVSGELHRALQGIAMKLDDLSTRLSLIESAIAPPQMIYSSAPGVGAIQVTYPCNRCGQLRGPDGPNHVCLNG